jgi:hypothetical protein
MRKTTIVPRVDKRDRRPINMKGDLFAGLKTEAAKHGIRMTVLHDRLMRYSLGKVIGAPGPELRELQQPTHKHRAGRGRRWGKERIAAFAKRIQEAATNY